MSCWSYGTEAPVIGLLSRVSEKRLSRTRFTRFPSRSYQRTAFTRRVAWSITSKAPAPEPQVMPAGSGSRTTTVSELHVTPNPIAVHV